jgi:hypothetical protein
MIPKRKDRPRPPNWADFRRKITHRWALPFLTVDWLAEWSTFILSRMSLLELCEYVGTLSILVGVISYIVEAPERTKVKHYQAWQVINTAQGKGGSGGRIEALGELNDDGVSLVGVNVAQAYLQNVQLEGANLVRASLDSADMRGARLVGANLEWASMSSTNLRGANLKASDLNDADCPDADFNGATLNDALLAGATFDRADLRNADLAGIAGWHDIKSIAQADIHGIRNPPDGFTAWALSKGAVDIESDDAWNATTKEDFNGK